jgi:hypothetical protein
MSIVVVTAKEFVTVSGIGIQGPGGVTSAVVSTAQTLVPLSGHRAVCIRNGYAEYADNTTPLVDVAGITTGSGSIEVPIHTFGLLTEPSWDWTEGDIYLGTEGNLTQVVPSSGYLVRLGHAVSPTTILVSIDSPVQLG